MLSFTRSRVTTIPSMESRAEFPPVDAASRQVVSFVLVARHLVSLSILNNQNIATDGVRASSFYTSCVNNVHNCFINTSVVSAQFSQEKNGLFGSFLYIYFCIYIYDEKSLKSRNIIFMRS